MFRWLIKRLAGIMSAENLHRKRCTVTPGPKFAQTSLLFRDGLLGYVAPSKPRHPRTPAPHAIRRIANSAVFRTTNPSITSFLRFPAEIRIAIYRLLLKLPPTTPYVGYFICTTTRRFVLPRARCRNERYPWIRHGLFPAILECCRITSMEGREVLYGENLFQLGCFASSTSAWDTVNSWRIGEHCLKHIARVQDHNPRLREVFIAEQLTVFPRLRYLRIARHMSGEQWAVFLREYAGALQRIPMLEFHIAVAEPNYIAQHLQYIVMDRPRRLLEVEASCKLVYQRVLESHVELTAGRKLTWRFVECSDICSVNWDVYLSLE